MYNFFIETVLNYVHSSLQYKGNLLLLIPFLGLQQLRAGGQKSELRNTSLLIHFLSKAAALSVVIYNFFFSYCSLTYGLNPAIKFFRR